MPPFIVSFQYDAVALTLHIPSKEFRVDVPFLPIVGPCDAITDLNPIQVFTSNAKGKGSTLMEVEIGGADWTCPDL